MHKPLYCLLIELQKIQTNKPWTDSNLHCMKTKIHKTLVTFFEPHWKFFEFFFWLNIYNSFLWMFLSQKQHHSGQKISLLQKDTKSSLVNEWFDFSLYGLMIIVPNFLENLVCDKTFKLIYSNWNKNITFLKYSYLNLYWILYLSDTGLFLDNDLNKVYCFLFL